MSCETCTLKNPVWGDPTDENGIPIGQFDIMIVGRNPGKTEALTGKPFVGGAGQVLSAIMRQVGLYRNACYITNIVKCPTPKDRPPTEKEIENCVSLLNQEMEKVAPKLIFVLGEQAMNLLTKKHKISFWRGTLIYISWRAHDPPTPVIPTFHPSYIMRGNQEMFPVVCHDFEKGLKYLKGDTYEKEFPKDPTTKINPTVGELEAVIQSFRQGYAFDIETGPFEVSLNPRKGNIISIALSDGDTTVSCLWQEPYISIIKQSLEDPNIPKIAQNSNFDVAFLEEKGVKVENLTFDTFLAAHTLCSDLPKNLNFLRSIYTNVPPYKEDKLSKRREVTQTQGCLDAAVTFRVARAQHKSLVEENLNKFYYEFFHPKLELIKTLNMRGVHIDKNQLVVETSKMVPRIRELTCYFESLDLNPNSPKQVADYLVRSGVPLSIKTSSKEQFKTSEKVLEKVLLRCTKEQRDKVNKIIEWSELDTDLTLLRGIYQRLEQNDIVYTQYLPTVAATGRLASRDPNLQNVEKRLRHIFKPPPDHVFIGFDYSQLEFVIMALLAGEDKILDMDQKGIRIHSVLGEMILGLKPEEMTDEQALKVKTVTFGTIYGRSSRSIAIAFGVTTAEAEVWQNKCLGEFPKLKKWRDDTSSLSKRDGKLRNPYGRIRRFYGGEVTKALNFPVQSGASDMVFDTMYRLHKEGFRVNLPVHDFGAIEIKSSIELSSLSQMQESYNGPNIHTQKIKEILSRPVPEFNGWRFRYKLKTGENWKEVS